MKTFTALAIVSAGLAASTTAEQELGREAALALSLLPESVQGDARVIERVDKESQTIAKEGAAGGFICRSDRARADQLRMTCFHPSLEGMDALQQELAEEGLRGEAFETALCERAEAATLLPPPGALEITASMPLPADGAQASASSFTVYRLVWMPGATTKTVGVRDTDPGDGSPWLHRAGTCQAHIMWSEDRAVP